MYIYIEKLFIHTHKGKKKKFNQKYYHRTIVQRQTKFTIIRCDARQIF